MVASAQALVAEILLLVEISSSSASLIISVVAASFLDKSDRFRFVFW